MPTPAGIYDYFLGGTHFSEADRQAAQQVMALAPEVRGEAIENRAFLQRAVRYVAGHGVTHPRPLVAAAAQHRRRPARPRSGKLPVSAR